MILRNVEAFNKRATEVNFQLLASPVYPSHDTCKFLCKSFVSKAVAN